MTTSGSGHWLKARCAPVVAVAVGLVATVMLVSLAGGGTGVANSAKPAPTQKYIFVHDPSMAKDGGVYYLFSTGDPAGRVDNGNIQIRTSVGLKHWAFRGSVFGTIPRWITSRLGDIPNLWAPDISYFSGLWHLYYAASTFGSNHSIIALATSPTLDQRSSAYHWTDDGPVIEATSSDDYNAIDPSLARGHGGTKWLTFGSYWSGIKLVELNPATGKLLSVPPKLYSLAEGPIPDALEGPTITSHAGYYYLLVSFGSCCRGIASTYRIMVGRSSNITGSYVGPNGKSMMSGGGMELQGSDQQMIGPGSPSVLAGAHRSLLVYHYYDAVHRGAPWVQIRQLRWASGWPTTGPPLVPVPGATRAHNRR